MTLIFVVILIALVFEYINGFHDTANSIATVVATKVLTPRQAVVMAACTNLVGALLGTAVATTIASGLIDPRVASQEVLICALLGAIIWNLVTWHAGLPSSSSHALVGGLVGAAVAAAGNWSVVIWSQPRPHALVSQQRTSLESNYSDVRIAALWLRAGFFHHGSTVRPAA
jgi:inorganic phosphate transporter, PiT family